jgi:hypothetical protein
MKINPFLDHVREKDLSWMFDLVEDFFKKLVIKSL